MGEAVCESQKEEAVSERRPKKEEAVSERRPKKAPHPHPTGDSELKREEKCLRGTAGGFRGCVWR